MSISVNDRPSAEATRLMKDIAGTKTVCVQGLGFVGAANAIAISSARSPSGKPLYNVIGVELANDLGLERAASLNEGRFPFATTDADLVRTLETAKEAGNLSAVTDSSAFASADIIVVDVGVDIDNKNVQPTVKLEPFRAALRAVGAHMRPDALVLLESTVPPGTCERIVAPLLQECLEQRGLHGHPIRLAYCYERIMPGASYLSSIVEMCRVYSGLNPEAISMAEEFLSSYIDTAKTPLFRLANIRSVEAAKVLENTYRAVNIALMDEWERFARGIDIDLFEILDAIRVRPTHSNIRYPGLGVGGYCLTKDPMFGDVSAREIYGLTNLSFPLSTLSVQINDETPNVTVDVLERSLGGSLRGKRVLILGASYRPDVGDTRLSPSATLAQSLIGRGAEVEIADPLVSSFEEVDAPLHQDLPAAEGYEAVILAVAHREYKEMDVLAWLGGALPVVLDSNGVLSREKLVGLREAGVKVAAIGRGGQA